MENNCHECEFSFSKALSKNETEFIDICLCDNSYIGYPKDSLNELCKFKTIKCIKSFSECTEIKKDNFGKLVGTKFKEIFIKGNCYKLISEKNETYEIFNEKNNISKFGLEINNFFEFNN